MGPRILLKNVCAIGRLRLWNYWYHSVCFPVVVWSPLMTCLALHKKYVCALLSLIHKTHIKTAFYFDQFPLNTRCLFIVCSNVSNLSQIDFRFLTYRWRALELRSTISLFSLQKLIWSICHFNKQNYVLPYSHMMYTI